MTTLTTQPITLAGEVPTLVAATAAGDKFRPGPGVFLIVANGGGAPITVTIDSKKLSNYGTDENVAVTVANGSRKHIAVADVARFVGADGLADVTYSADTTVTVGCFRA